MTMRIACAGISGRIIQGRVTADGLSFTGQTKDVTSDVLAAVIDKLKHHGGSFTINCAGSPVATLTLTDPAALSAPGQGEQVREGWQLVPVEPNEAIRDAINLLCDDHSAFEDSDAFWSYLLAAAPSAGSQGGDV